MLECRSEYAYGLTAHILLRNARMIWSAYLRRMALELIVFLVVASVVFYVVNNRGSLIDAIYMGLIATLFYGGITYILRQRATRKRDD